MGSNRKRLVSALISFFFVGGGQIYSKRYWAGTCFAILFYGSIVFMKVIWHAMNQGFWAAFGSLAVLWLYSILDAYKGYHYSIPPCEKACPAGIAPWLYINQVGNQTTWKYPFVPFFKILGLICPAPCELECTRRGIDEPVSIRELKSAVECETPVKVHVRRTKKIGVIGAGPCGLTLAYELTRRGYGVTVYEREQQAGGVLAAFIPKFRLPSAVVENAIADILKIGFEIKYGIAVGRDITIDDLLGQHDFLFLATGAWKPVKLGIPGEENGLVGLDILRRAKRGEQFHLGKAGVIGGGNTAFDLARSLRRMGNEVKIYYRRRFEDIPAEAENRIEAEEEGIEVIPLTMPARINKNGIIMVKTECTEGRQGALKVLDRTEYEIKLDNIIMAIGQRPDTDFLKDRLVIDDMSCVVTKKGRTSHARIFAGGDVVHGPKTLAHAVGHGIAVAQELDYHTRGVPSLLRAILRNDLSPDGVALLKLNDSGRLKINHRPVAERLLDCNPSEEPISQEQLRNEACRCLTCPVRYR